ncbi:MAG: mercuric reductase [Planctomycetota bacterium]|jgi:pyruvate/2-oxoglutarate dehydrogenase complex dihydrolipoamide dehydrogenase (E3) component
MSDTVRVEPMDDHNRALVANAHPSDWVNPEAEGRYNLVVIGAGTAGLVAAAGAAGLGAKVALVEKHLLGGDCLNVGCVPSKSIISASRLAAEISRAGEYGLQVKGGCDVDFPAVMERMRRLRSRISVHDSAERFRGLGVEVFFGEGRFTGPDTVEVAGRELRFTRAIIATGARAVRPDIEGLEEAGFLTNETVFSLTERPRRLGVFGAGPIGCELAQAFARLGCEVSIIQRRDKLLPREDADATKILFEAIATDGVSVLLNTAVHKVSTSGEGKTLHMLNGDRPSVLEVDEVLVGAGRAPNVEGSGLEEAGVAYDVRGGVKVDDFLRTTNPRIFAAGDVCLRYKFTHSAEASARIALQNALFWGRKRLSALTIPWCTYTDPEIAHVGLYPEDAAERGIEVDTFERNFEDVDRAICDGREDGFVKIHVRKGSDRIVGATIVAAHAGDMISEISVAMTAGLGLGSLANVIHPYPTVAEAIRQCGDLYNRTRLTPFVKGFLKRILKWRR